MLNIPSYLDILKLTSTAKSSYRSQNSPSSKLSNSLKESKNENKIEEIIQVISSCFDEVAEMNSNKDAFDENKSNSIMFNFCLRENQIPSICIKDYLLRIFKLTKFELSTLLLTMIYVDKLIDNGNLKISKNNMHK